MYHSFLIDFPIDRSVQKQLLLPPSNNATQAIQEPATPTVHVLTSSDDEVKYAKPGAVCQPPVNPREVSTHSEPILSRPQSKWSEYNISLPYTPNRYSGGVKADPMYANLPM